MLVSGVHPVAILSAVFCVICSLLMFVMDTNGNPIVEAYSNMDLVMGLYMISIISLYFPHYGRSECFEYL